MYCNGIWKRAFWRGKNKMQTGMKNVKNFICFLFFYLYSITPPPLREEANTNEEDISIQDSVKHLKLHHIQKS
jgi:hypothetical protein